MVSPALGLLAVPVLAASGLALPAWRRCAAAYAIVANGTTTLIAWWQLLLPSSTDRLPEQLRADAAGLLLLALVNSVSLAVAVYVRHRAHAAPQLQAATPRFAALALVFVAACNLALMSRNLLLSWLALEFSTLAIAPLIALGGARSRRASYHYLLFSSLGLALAGLGFGCLGHAMERPDQPLAFDLASLQLAAAGSRSVMGALGVALAVLGLGTKLGLAPMYTWLPETYDEAPPAVSALLGAAQFNCALALLLRVVQLFLPYHTQLMSRQLVAMGLASMLISTASLVTAWNIRRVIAGASINHAGVIAIALGTGKAAAYGMFLYVLANAIIKTILFLTAGHIEAHYKSKDTREIGGLLEELPYSGIFLMLGSFALLGFPPFGSFLGELLILSALVSAQQLFVFGSFCAILSISFVSLGRTLFPMIWRAPNQRRAHTRQSLLAASPKLAFVLLLVLLGVYIPPHINVVIRRAAAALTAS